MTTTTMTVTAPTENPGEMAVFKIEFEKSKFDEVVEMAGLLVKPTDVAIVEEFGLWTVLG